MNSLELLKKQISEGGDIFEGTATPQPATTPAPAPAPIKNQNVFGDFSGLEEMINNSAENISVETSNIESKLVEEATGATDAITAKPSEGGGEGEQYLTGSGAKMYVMTFDLLVSRFAAGFAVETDYKKFKLSTQERKDFETVCSTYFDSVQIKISPTLLFVLLNILFFGGTMWKAYNVRKLKKEAQQRKRKYERLAEQKAKTQNGQISLFNENPKEEQEETREKIEKVFNNAKLTTKRGRFEIDKLGRYLRTEKGKYIPADERLEEAPHDIRELIEDGKTNKEIKAYIKEVMTSHLSN